MAEAWAFSNRNDLDRTGKSIKVTEGLTSTFGSNFSANITARYARVTELIEGETKIAKGMAVKWDELILDWEDNEDGPIYDYEVLTAGDGTATAQHTTNIISPSDLSVDQVVRLQFYPGLAEDSVWLVLETGGGTEATLLDILEADEETGIYTANILDNPTDRNATTEGVNVKTLEGLSNFQALVGQPMFASQSYTEDIPEDEIEEATEENPEPATTRLVYYVNPPILFDPV